MQFLVLLSVILAMIDCETTGTYPVPTETTTKKWVDKCQQPLVRGTSGPNSGVKYYFDFELYTCLAYYFEGENEGLNSFEKKGGCHWKCALQDWFVCAGGQPSDISCRWGEKCEKEGFGCKGGNFGDGLCCNTTIEEQYSRELYPTKCSDGRSLSVDQDSSPIMGRNCEDKFCPESADCEQGIYISHCCEGNVSDSYSVGSEARM